MAETPATIRTESNGPLVNGIAIGFTSTTAVFMILRFYTRGAILKNIGKDDWTMLAATVSEKSLARFSSNESRTLAILP